MQISLFQAFLIGVVYYLGQIGTPWLSLLGSISVLYKPLVAGTIVGFILGDPVQGCIIGAAINLPYIAFISAGGTAPQDPGLAGTLGTALAIHLLHRYAVRRQTPATYRGGLPGFRLKRVLDFVGDNLAEELSLQQLADIAGMSPHYFAHLFKQSTGSPPHRYVLSRKIERAKEKLAGSRRGNVTEIGFEVGFQNPIISPECSRNL